MSIILIVAGQPVALCYAPTLLVPENGTYEDLSGTPEFQWQYNAGNPSAGTTQTAWQFERITNGGVTQYWNATSSSWQSTPVSGGNSGSTTPTNTTFSYTFPSGAFVDGNVYQWTVATYDVNGEGPFASYFSVTSQALPTVTVSAPTGTITTADPIVTWSTVFPTGASQTTYRLAIYNAATYGAPGFVPGGTTSPDPNAVYDTGVIGSSNTNNVDLSKVPFYLPNGTSYRAYVQIGETGGQVSNWAYGTGFTVNFAPPKAPTIAVSAVAVDGQLPYIDTVTQCHDNLLSSADAIPENGSSLGTWAGGANTTLGSGTAPDGFFALKLTASAAGNISAQTASGTAAYPVLPSTLYGVTVDIEDASTARTCTLGIAWYGSTGTLISTSTSTGFLDSALGTSESFFATSPSNAAFAAVVVTVESAGASEVHWFRHTGIFIGSDGIWGPGGFDGLQELILLRSDGLYVRGASITNPAAVPAASQYLEIKDPEAYQNTLYTYSAQVLVTYGANQSVLSPLGTSGDVTLDASATGGSGHGPAWIMDPTDPFTNPCNAQFTNWNPLQVEQSSAHMVTGMVTMNVVADTVLNKDVNCTATTFTDADYANLIALTTTGKTLFITTLWGAHESGYFRVGPQSGGLSMGTGNRTKDATLHPSVFGAGYRDTQLTAVAQNRPPV